MKRVNYRKIRDRFTHIDAMFVSCELGYGEITPRYTVSFYPWWEHPTVIDAEKQGRKWCWADGEAWAKPVTVYPIDLRCFRVTKTVEVNDWLFTESHPLLWEYEESQDMYCNTTPDIGALIESVAGKLENARRCDIYRYLDPMRTCGVPFNLGRLPYTLFNAVEASLRELDVKAFSSSRPEKKNTPVLLLIDDGNYIVADDFELDVPEWGHHPQWCQMDDS